MFGTFTRLKYSMYPVEVQHVQKEPFKKVRCFVLERTFMESLQLRGHYDKGMIHTV